MFEGAELGRSVSKAYFKAQLPELRTRLLKAQRQLRHSDIPVIILIAGVEGGRMSTII